MNEKEFFELAAGHALGALSPEDEKTFADALAAHPEWSAQVERDMAVVAWIADGVPAETPSPSVRDSLLARIAATPQSSAADGRPGEEPPAPDEVAAEPDEEGADPDIALDPPTEQGALAASQAPRRSGWGPKAWFALAASVALLLGIGGTAAVLVGQLDRPAAVVALERIEDAPDAQSATGEFVGGGEATVHWSESVGEAVLTADSMPALEADQAYELWYVRDGEAISAGAFDPAEDTTTALLRGEMHAGDVIALTVEQAGGSPTGQPTSEPVIAIPTA